MLICETSKMQSASPSLTATSANLIQPPVDLVTGPVVGAALFRIRDEEYVFLLVLHDIVCDGPSIAIVLEELAHFYGGSLKGRLSISLNLGCIYRLRPLAARNIVPGSSR